MQGLGFFLLVALGAILNPTGAVGGECSDDETKNHQVYLTLRTKRDDHGKWVSAFNANKSASIQHEGVDVDVSRKYTVCRGKHVFSIAGTIRDSSDKQIIQPGGLFFKRCSSDAAMSKGGRTLERIIANGYGSAITNRPLMDDEIFTVRLDKKKTDKGYVLGIGVTTHSPETLDVPNHLFFLRSGVWMFYHNHLYQNGTIINKNYAKTNLSSVKVGQTVSVMRSRYGNLHLFIEGVDQGPAASNIPATVWGAFDLHGDALKATIVDE